MRSRISAATALPSSPGAIVFAARRRRPRVCLSARAAPFLPPAPPALGGGGARGGGARRGGRLAGGGGALNGGGDGGGGALPADQPADLRGSPYSSGRDRLLGHALSLRVGCRPAMRFIT